MLLDVWTFGGCVLAREFITNATERERETHTCSARKEWHSDHVYRWRTAVYIARLGSWYMSSCMSHVCRFNHSSCTLPYNRQSAAVSTDPGSYLAAFVNSSCMKLASWYESTAERYHVAIDHACSSLQLKLKKGHAVLSIRIYWWTMPCS